jgi:hypothetical protein
MPAHAALAQRGPRDLVRQTAAVLLVGSKVGGQGQATPGVNTGTSLWWPQAQTRRERAMGAIGESPAPSSKRRPPWGAKRASRAPDARRQHGAHRRTRHARETPDGHPSADGDNACGASGIYHHAPSRYVCAASRKPRGRRARMR